MGRKATLPPIGQGSLWGAVLAAAALAVAGPACAQVLDIGADGSVTRYAGPAVYTDQGVRSLIPQAAQAQAAPAEVAPIEISRAIQDSAQRHAVSASLAEAVAWQESRFHQQAVSPKGALGVMQLMPATARTLGVDAADLKGNVDGGVIYLGQMLKRFEGDLPRALAAYNAGPEAVARYGGVPPYAETRAYVQAILGHLSAVSLPAVSLPRVGAE
ncbi:MAG TPA: lytic transglycosylase domain-containing protein [Phenylobacterium sp.]|nr:lytic transglycosylase domain-containing protein [Phenylobacterium sp.]